MPTPEQEQLDANIDLLLAIQFDGMDPVARQNLTESMEDIREEYRQAAEKGKTSKYYKDLGESIAKSLPNIVKGAMAASEAFKKGDYISGSAAIMDVCASIIPVFASLLSATGPEGALVGALFSVIGQILSFFAPKQPSLEEKIQKMLDHLQSEQQIINITAVGHGINAYTSSLRTKCMGIHKMENAVVLAGTVSLTPESKTVTGTGTSFTQSAELEQWLVFDSDTSRKPYKIAAIANDTSLTLATPYSGAPSPSTTVKLFCRKTIRRGIAEILAMPLETETQADSFIEEMKELKWGLVQDQAKLLAPEFANWEVAGYLERPENQKKEGWPEVLGIWCRTYTDLLTANMMLNCLADPKTLDSLIHDTQESNDKSPLPANAKKDCHTVLRNLKALAGMLRHSWESDKKEMLKIVEAVRPTARERGLYVSTGHWSGGRVLYVAAGRKGPLDWQYKKNTGWMQTFSINVPKDQVGSDTPKYELLTCQEDPNAIERFTLDSVTANLYDRSLLLMRMEKYPNQDGSVTQTFNGCVDVSSLPDANDQRATRIYTAHASGYWYVNIHVADAHNKVTRSNWEPHTSSGLAHIRAVDRPSATLADDPDGAAIPQGQYEIIYGGYSGNGRIWVELQNSWAEVPSPWEEGYNGIEVDPYYLWVFGSKGFACATHTSVVQCKNGKLPSPRWITYKFKWADFSQSSNPPNLTQPADQENWVNSLNILSLCPCADGTLSVSLQNNSFWTANYEIRLKDKRIDTNAWVLRGGEGDQIQKMPIPCWSLLESLKANLLSD